MDAPFSFRYGGRPSAEFLSTWKTQRSSRAIDSHRTEFKVTYTDTAGDLAIRCVAVADDDFPTVEWTVYFTNTGTAPTPILENIQAIETPLR
jgi:alpha-galactosidase